MRDVPKDAVVSFADVMMPPNGEVEALWREQFARWPQGTRGSQESPDAASAQPVTRGRGLLVRIQTC